MISEIIIGAAVVGLLVGSFLNMLATRIPLKLDYTWHKDCQSFLQEKGINVPNPEKGTILGKMRSCCPKCHSRLAWYDNIPILSYLFLAGRCRSCKRPIARRYFLLELFTLAATVHLTFYFPLGWALAASALFVWSLLLLTAIDFEHQILPDEITIPMLWAGLLFHLHMGSPIALYIYGALFGYLSLWFVAVSFELITKREGMGLGDAKLLAMLGAWCGVDMVLPIILISSLLALLIQGINILVMSANKRLPFAYGPYLAAAGYLMYLHGPEIMSAYYQFTLGN